MTADDPNRYLPPKARVDDTPSRQLTPQPRTVVVALVLLWAQLAIDSLGSFGALLDAPRVEGMPWWDFPVRCATAIAVTALFAWLIWKIAVCRNWARVTYLVVVLCGLAWFFVELSGGFGVAITPTVGTLVTNALPVIAMALLFAPSANGWFRNGA